MRHDWCISSGVLYTGAYPPFSRWWFWGVAVPWRWSDFFHIGAWDMIGAFHLVYFTQRHTPFDPWWFLGIVVPWRWLDSFYIGVRDMIKWFLWCDYRSIAFSSLLTYFLRWLDQNTGTYESMQRSFSHFRVCPILGHNPFIGGWSQRH